MEPLELLGHVIQYFENFKIPYFVTGALASIAYGEPRLTNNIDIVVDIRESSLADLKKHFPEGDFYLDIDFARKAIRGKSQFNIIHPASGLKIDLIVCKNDAFDQSRFSRLKKLKPLIGLEANFAAPEDVIIKKMEYYREGGSEKHLRDISGMLRISPELIDTGYISDWAKTLGLQSIWEIIMERLKKSQH